MKPLHSLLILLFLITNALGLSRVAVPDTYSSTYDNWTFNHNVIQAFARLNGTWSPDMNAACQSEISATPGFIALYMRYMR